MRAETHCHHFMGYSSDQQQGFLYMHHPTDRITHTIIFVLPVAEHWLGWQIADMEKKDNRLYNQRKEGNVLFNDALNTFYLRLYGVSTIKERNSLIHIIQIKLE